MKTYKQQLEKLGISPPSRRLGWPNVGKRGYKTLLRNYIKTNADLIDKINQNLAPDTFDVKKDKPRFMGSLSLEGIAKFTEFTKRYPTPQELQQLRQSVDFEMWHSNYIENKEFM